MEEKDNYSLPVLLREFKNFLFFLAGKWYILLISVLIGIGLGFLFYKIQKPKYQAITTFILEEKSGGGGLAGLASQFGFNMGSLSGGESIFAGDNILNILQSKKVVQDVLLTSIDEKGSKTLADAFLDFSGLKNKLKSSASVANVKFSTAKLPLGPEEDSVLNVIYARIIKNYLTAEKTSRQGTIYRVQVTSENSVFARVLSERLVSEASKLYLDVRIGTAQKNISDLQNRSDSLLVMLNTKSFKAAASQQLDVNPGVRTATVPMEIASRDKTVLATLYAEVTKNLEASKMLLSQETPVIQLLDKPQYLLDDNKRSLAFLVFVSTTATVAITLMLTFLFLVFYRFRVKGQENGVLGRTKVRTRSESLQAES
jgi:uncharacterized protein involved in exopolysaccharide biosynthesis